MGAEAGDGEMAYIVEIDKADRKSVGRVGCVDGGMEEKT